MLRINELKLPLDHDDAQLVTAIATSLDISEGDIADFTVFKRSYDARKKSNIQLIYQIDLNLAAPLEQQVLSQHKNNNMIRPSPDSNYKMPEFPSLNGKIDGPKPTTGRPVIVGFGPCGILAALLLAQMGLRPIVLERGKDVRRRTQDTWKLWRHRELNPESNVQYGEGGAGTFSDGKLYSQVKDKRHLGRKVLTEFVKAGAPADILWDSRPHIGTFKLVSMVEKLRAEIIRLGGEIRFDQKVTAIDREVIAGDQGAIKGVQLNSGEWVRTHHLVVAIGHSARDSFQMLLDEGVYIEAKPFSIGFRIEHPQTLIDKARFGKEAGNPILGAAEYKLVHHCKNGRSVYSFCMCPGGTVVAATSEENSVVTNGMSQYSRNERNANAAIVVGINPEQDYPEHPLAGLDLQRQLEKAAFILGGENYSAPVQLVGDFLEGRPSKSLGIVTPSYTPGIRLGELDTALPKFAIAAIREAIPEFNKKIPGYALDDAVLTGVETRTSSPIRMTRDQQFESINTHGLYPAGEGAGYAGGILSAAIDGIKVAEAVAKSIYAGSGD